jgi:hypothetical protein
LNNFDISSIAGWRRVMALKIDATVIAYGPQPDTNLALIEVTVEFDRPDESMTVKILMADGADRTTLTKRGIERAQSLARRFADFPTGAA